MRARIRVTATLDKDGASPDSIAAAQTYLTGLLFERATNAGVALDWSTWRSAVRGKGATLFMAQWAKVLK